MAFAGLIALDGEPLPAHLREAWPPDLQRRGWAGCVRQTPDAMFIAWFASRAEERMAGGPAKVDVEDDATVTTMCDARLDEPRATTIAAADLLGQRLDAARGGAFFEVTGEFAFARWSAADGELLLACDAMGCRPIYFARCGARVAFSTDLPILLALPGLSRQLNPVRLADHLLATGATQVGATCYADIRQVPSGHQWRIGQGAEGAPIALERPPALAARAGGNTAAALRSLIEEAVVCRLPDDGVVAVHLSGGLDSSAIACVAARHLRRQGRRLVALCSVLPEGMSGPESDERSHIDAVLAQEDTIDPVWVRAAPEQFDIFGALAQWLDGVGSPPYNNVTHAFALLGAAGRSHGVEVVLNGFGGDLFASCDGTGSVLALLRAGRWRDAWMDLAAQRRLHGWRHAVRRELLMPLRARSRLQAPPLAGTIVRREVLEALHAQQPFCVGAARHRLVPLGPQEVMREIVRPGNLDYPTSGVIQFLSRACGQDLRLPLLDLRIVEFMQHVPLQELRRGGVPRGLFRDAVRGIVPESVRLRPDKGAPLDPGLMSRIVASRESLQAWAGDDSRPCWQFLDRDRFLSALAQVRPAARHEWRGETFLCVLMAGAVGKFIDWHARQQATQWR